MLTKNTYKKVDFASKILFIIVVILLGLFYLKSILTPLIFSILLTQVLIPICDKFESWKINKIISISLVLLIVFLITVSIGVLLSIQFNNFITDFPNLLQKMEDWIIGSINNIESAFNISQQRQLGLLKENSSELIKTGAKYFRTALGATTNLISFLSLVPVYCFLLLLYREKFKNVILKLSPENKKEKTVDILNKIQNTVQQYVIGLFSVILIIAVLNIIGLFSLGIKYALFLGLFSALLTIIPYVGVVIGGLLPVLVALITKDSIWYAIGVVGLYWLVQFLEGNFITPKIVGNQVNLNAFAVIFGLIAGGRLWGLIGLIMAVPLIAILKVIFSNIDGLKPFASLLGK